MWWAFCVSPMDLIIKSQNFIHMENTKKAFFKRWWFWAIVVVVLFIIASSNGSKTPQKVGDSGSTTPSETEVTDKTFKVGDQVKLGDSTLIVNSVSYSQGGQFSKPSAGNEWVNLNITIENMSSSQQYITTLGQMYVRDGQNNSYQVAVTDKSIESINNHLDGAIIAKSKRTGWVGFEIPKGATGLQFQYNGSLWGGGTILVDIGR